MKTLDDLQREQNEFLELELCLSSINGMIGIICFFLYRHKNIAADKIEKLNEILKLLFHERNMFYSCDIDIRERFFSNYSPAIKQFYLNFKTGEIDVNDTLKIFD
ncbi:MAG: hypothetical protein LBT40_17870 [Deltaproteobacteria bacterium]|jgi:hypothetical protein|nr:hypothetical protein [Deltaproteobacteria bacterium]